MVRSILMFILISISGYSQRHGQIDAKIQIKPFAGYGILSITQLQNPNLYEYVYTKGDFIGGFSCKFNSDFRYVAFVGYEKTHPVLQGTTVNKEIFVKTTYFGAGLQYYYFKHNRFNLYSGISTLLIKAQKQLPLENGIIFKNSLDLTIIGVEYCIGRRMSTEFQIGAGESGFIKGVVCF